MLQRARGPGSRSVGVSVCDDSHITGEEEWGIRKSEQRVVTLKYRSVTRYLVILPARSRARIASRRPTALPRTRAPRLQCVMAEGSSTAMEVDDAPEMSHKQRNKEAQIASLPWVEKCARCV